MRNKILTAMMLALALSAGCSFSAGISRGDEIDHSVLVDNDDFRRVFNSSVRVRAYNANDSLVWMGSANIIKIEGNRIRLLSNNHVMNDAHKITGEFFVDGESRGEFILDVDACWESDGIDIAVASLPMGKTLKGVEAIPLATNRAKVGEEIFWVGSSRGEWPNGQLGRVTMVEEQYLFAQPTAIGGDSGSSIIQFNSKGDPEIVGLIAWRTTIDGVNLAMAMHSDIVMDVLAGGDLPDLPNEGDVPPSNLETERLIQGLLQRLREMREDNHRERKGLLDRLSQMQLENAMLAEQSQLWRDRFKKENDEKLDNIENNQGNQDSIVEGLSRKFDNLKTLLRWSFYGLVALLIAALFFKQGWATTVIICIVTFVARTIKLAYLLMHNAIVAKVKNPKTMSEALEDLQDGISEGIGRSDDSAD